MWEDTKLRSRKQAEIIVAELEYWHYLALNYWHSFKICSLTNTLMLWPWNFGELCPIFYQNTQIYSLAEAMCFEDIDFSTGKTIGVSQDCHCCAHAWAPGCGTATPQAPKCWSGRASSRQETPAVLLWTRFRTLFPLNRTEELKQRESRNLVFLKLRAAGAFSSLSEGTLYLQRTRQQKGLSSRVVLGYGCCCSEPEPQMDPSYARHMLNPSVTELIRNLPISSLLSTSR